MARRPAARPARRGPGTFGKRKSSGGRPGCTTHACPVSPDSSATQTASATSCGRSSGKPACSSRARTAPCTIGVSAMPGHTTLIEMPRPWSGGAALRTNPTTACFVAAYTGSSGIAVRPPSDAVHTIRPPSPHHLGETAHAQHDAVDVDAHRAAVAVDREACRVGRPAEHTGVETGDVDRADGVPGGGIGDVEAGRQVEDLDLEAFRPQPLDDRRADPGRTAGHQRLHGTSTTLPVERRSSIRRCASAASASGNVAPTIGWSSP